VLCLDHAVLPICPEPTKTATKNGETRKRRIKGLVHFTRLENLNSIIEFGLWPRAFLDELKVDYIYNDEIRIDSCSNASCLSLSFPNYKMFYTCRMNNRGLNWIVLSLFPNILWEKDCAFCHKNAASKEVTCISLQERKKPEAFLKLFEDYEDSPKRTELKIPMSYPTNPQAEILIFDPIEIEYIKGISFQNQKLTSEAKNKYKKYRINCIYHPGAFYPRSDYKHWQNQTENSIFDELFI